VKIEVAAGDLKISYLQETWGNKTLDSELVHGIVTTNNAFYPPSLEIGAHVWINDKPFVITRIKMDRIRNNIILYRYHYRLPDNIPERTTIFNSNSEEN
jgi:hypothetical protein